MEQNLKINVASGNKVKVEAVKEILADYPHLKNAEVESVEVNSGVSAQPKTLDETVAGAMNRARSAFVGCDYAIGLESGLMVVPKTKSGHMDVCVCAIYDGKEYHIGLSSAWEFPNKSVMELMLKEELDMNQAAKRAGLTNKDAVGSEEGTIGILTKGLLTRKEYTKQALRTALIHLERFDF